MHKNKVVVDSDELVGFERNSFWEKVLDFFLIPIFNRIPARFESFIRKSNKGADEIIEHRTSHKALEVLYERGERHRKKSLLQRLFHFIWFNTNNSKAVRNRLRIVKREMRSELFDLRKEKKDVRILSIASGSARAVVEVVEEFDAPDFGISLLFLDKNPQAIEYSKQLVKNRLRYAKARWVNDTVGSLFKKHLHGENFDIVEMVGLLDYFDDQKTEDTFTSIHEVLNDNGILITANINDNSERPFVTKAIGWDMVYRTADELYALVLRGGFDDSATHKILYEPLKVHSVIVARKNKHGS